jgi:predicted ATPase/DNA-binding winged helix-turn-helix (wHTH) protein
MKPSPRDSFETYQVGPFTLVPSMSSLMRDGKNVRIGQKPFEILVALVKGRGRLLTKADLLDAIWPDQIVEENCLQAHMSALRKVLGADRDLISTEFGKGYRLAESRLSTQHKQRERFSPLPVSLLPMVGRTREVAELAQILQRSRLVTITGTGGIGKSRTAIEIASSLGDDFPGGVCLIELSLIADPSLIASTVISSLRLIPSDTAPSSDHDDVEEELLLVLDNCEHALEEVCNALLTVRAFPHVKVLSTSQEPLGLEGEQVYRLQPLTLPPPQTAEIEEVLRYPAAELLAARINEFDSTFRLTNADASNICRICRQLDGIPLAIELAAARVPLLGLHNVVTDLNDRFRLLTAGRRSALPRHRTLQATLDWSFSLLNEHEKIFLKALSIFAGSFTVTSAEFLIGANQETTTSALVASLVSKSLVAVERHESSSRFRLLESLRAFLLEKLTLDGDLHRLADRHAELFRMRLAQAARDWRFLPPDRWAQQYEDDINDVRAALDWTFSETGDPLPAADLLCSSLPFWMQLSRLDECGERVELALKRLTEFDRLSDRQEMQLSAALGASTAWVDGPTPKAERAWSRSLTIAQKVNDNDHLLQACYGLWLYHLRCGNYRDSHKNAQAMFETALACEDSAARYAAQRIRGVSLHFLGQHGQAAVELDDLQTTMECNDSPTPFRFGVDQKIAALSFRCRVLSVQGEYDAALVMATKAVDQASCLGHISTHCCALLEGACTVAAFARNAGVLEEFASKAWAIADQSNLGFWRTYAKAFLALSRSWQKRDILSLDLLGAAISSLRHVNLHPSYTIMPLALAEMQMEQREVKAVPWLQSIAPESEYWATPEYLRLQAKLATDTHKDALLSQAIKIAKNTGSLLWLERLGEELAGVDEP